MNLVIDASVAVAASATPLGFARLHSFDLVGPPLLWVEAVSALHAALWRGELRRGSSLGALAARGVVLGAESRTRRPP